MIKKGLFFVLAIISMFLLSACDVYNTLYIQQPGVQSEVMTIPESDIVIEDDFIEIGEDEINDFLSEIQSLEEETEDEVINIGEEDVIIELTDEDVVIELTDEVVVEESDNKITGAVVFEEVVEEVIEVEESEFVEEVEPEIVETTIIEAEETYEEETSGEATIIIVEETELISLLPKAQDPDDDVLIFTFTSPLDNDGEWQTGYGDAGEYTITVTASDGKLTASKEVLIIVKKKEEAPVLNSFSPTDTVIEIKETETVDFRVTASDSNNDVLTYVWKLDGDEVSNENTYTFKSTHDDSGSHTVKVAVSDGIFDTEKLWAVTVGDINRKPTLEQIDDITAKETDTVVIELLANDLDGDDLEYNLNDGRFLQDENVFVWETNYDDAGTYTVTVSVSDGVDTTSQQVAVTIENVNRAPVILDIVQKQ